MTSARAASIPSRSLTHELNARRKKLPVGHSANEAKRTFSSKRIVLTRRGEGVRQAIRDAVGELEGESATLLGPRRFALLKQLLREPYEARAEATTAGAAARVR